MYKRTVFFTIILLTACWIGVSSATAVNFLGNRGLENFGLFSGNLSYTPIDAHDATLTITLINASPAANGGYLTGLAFNNPANDIRGVSLATTPATAAFHVLGAASGGKKSPPGFQNGISADPYGNFDIGASTGNNFQGGGKPQVGLTPGQSLTFIFSLTGNNLNTLTTLSFAQELSTGGQFLAARFQAFNNGLSDKVPGFASTFSTTSGGAQAPIPSTLVLLGTALAGLAGLRKLSRS